MNMRFEDCYCKIVGDELRIGNNNIERTLSLERKYPINIQVRNKISGHSWQGSRPRAMFNLGVPNPELSSYMVDACVTDNDGLSEGHLKAILLFKNEAAQIKLELRVFPQTPFITSQIFLKPTKNGLEAFADNN